MSTGIISPRMRQLLTAAADALDDGQIPMSDHFLRTHDVSFEEAHLLADLMVTVMRAFLKMPKNQQGATFIAGASDMVDSGGVGYITAVAIKEDYVDQMHARLKD